MQVQIATYFEEKKDFKAMDLFGYATKGLPGLEILGLGKKGALLKEKFHFLTKHRQLKLPLKRYVLACSDEIQFSQVKSDSWREIELPFLLMYWTLGECLALRNLRDCFCAGKINIHGRIDLSPIPNKFIGQEKKWIAQEGQLTGEAQRIPLEQLFCHIPNISFQIKDEEGQDSRSTLNS